MAEARQHFNVAVIGGGPAGMAAALYACRAGLTCAVFEGMGPGGQMAQTEKLDNYPGFPDGTDAISLAFAMDKQAERFGAVKVGNVVNSLLLNTVKKEISVASGETYTADAVILAMGAEPKKLGIPGEEELRGRGVSYCATCDGGFFRGKAAVVAGGGNTAVGDALYLSRVCRKVYLVHRRDAFRADAIYTRALQGLENVEVVLDSVVEAARSSAEADAAMPRVAAVDIRNVKTNEARTLEADALFIAVGVQPRSALLEGSGVALNAAGYVVADEDGATNIPGVFVAGDLREKPLRQVVTAVADGANAATSAFEYLSTKGD